MHIGFSVAGKFISRKLHQDFPVARRFPELHPGFEKLSMFEDLHAKRIWRCDHKFVQVKRLIGPKNQGGGRVQSSKWG